MYPTIFKIGSFELHSYGVMMVIAFMAAIGLAQARAAKYGFTKQQVSDLAFWALISGVLGARVGFIVQEVPYFLKNPSELYSLQFKGLTSFGGLIGGAIAVIVWARIRRVPIFNVLDLCAPAFVVGHAIGRIGCLLNGCCFGGVCPVGTPLGVHVEGSSLLHYPVQIYDTAMNLLVAGVLLAIEKRGLRLGQLTGLALILHGLTRVIYEFWRAGTVDQVREGLASSTYWGTSTNHYPFTQAQVMAAAIMAVGMIICVICEAKKATRPPGEVKNWTGKDVEDSSAPLSTNATPA